MYTTLDYLTQIHPTWTLDNLKYLFEEYSSSTSRGTRTEVLLQAPCTNCGLLMGEHTYQNELFHCPDISEEDQTQER